MKVDFATNVCRRSLTLSGSPDDSFEHSHRSCSKRSAKSRKRSPPRSPAQDDVLTGVLLDLDGGGDGRILEVGAFRWDDHQFVVIVVQPVDDRDAPAPGGSQRLVRTEVVGVQFLARLPRVSRLLLPYPAMVITGS